MPHGTRAEAKRVQDTDEPPFAFLDYAKALPEPPRVNLVVRILVVVFVVACIVGLCLRTYYRP